MESTMTVADAKGQLAALAYVNEAAILEAHPAPKWWTVLIGGLIGPLAVIEHLADGTAGIALTAAVMAVFLVGAVAEFKSSRVRRSKLSVPRRVMAVTGLCAIAVGAAAIAINPVAANANRYLLGALSYVLGVIFFSFYAKYLSRAIAECSRNARDQ